MGDKLRKTLVSTSVGILLLAVLATYVGWNEIFNALLQSSPRYIALALLSSLGVWLFWTLSWVTIMENSGHSFSFGKHVMVFFGGLFANNVTPMGRMGGEPFIAWVLKNNSDESYESSLAAVITADFINAIPFFSFTLLGLFLFAFFYSSTIIVTLISIVVFIVGLFIFTIIFIGWRRKEMAEGIAVWFVEKLKYLMDSIGLLSDGLRQKMSKEHIMERIGGFYDTIHSVASSKYSLLQALFFAHVAWFFQIVALYFLLVSVGWTGGSLTYILLILPLSTIAAYFPSPGGIGGFEIMIVLLLILIAQVPLSIASVAIILYRGMLYILPIIIGGICLLELSTGASGIKKMFEEDIGE